MPKKTPRTFKRLSYIALAFIKLRHTAPLIEAHVINLSYGGVAVYSSIELQGQVEITILHEDEGIKPVAETLWGNVAWSRKVGSLTAYGIEFGNLNPDDHQITMSLIETFLK